MMGFQSDFQPRLFYHQFNLEQRIPEDHILRRIRDRVDFDFIYADVKGLYGERGNVSIAPPVILKMMLLLVLYNVRSERELIKTIPLRLDWIWFLGYDLDSAVPDHSVLSKARARWGHAAFKAFFERIVWQCVQAGLVDGRKVFVDSSFIQADASNDSIVSTERLKEQIAKGFHELESRLDEQEPQSGNVNSNHQSTTDPDASVGKGKQKLQYKIHRSVDEKNEIITATQVTPGAVSEAHQLLPLLSVHQENTQLSADTVVADAAYGTIENYIACGDLGINAHIPDLKDCQKKGGLRNGLFTDDAFLYDPEHNVYRCPAGKELKRRGANKKRKTLIYKCSARVCDSCHLKNDCTPSKHGRSVHRHIRQRELDRMRLKSKSAASRADIRTRQHLMERSFARAVRFGFKRARWRRLWRVGIQEYLTSAIQNIMVLLKFDKELKASAMKCISSIEDRLLSGGTKPRFNAMWKTYYFFPGLIEVLSES
jgi:transposase